MKVNSRVVSDKFENEIVVVNLQNGFYYSFRNSAASIWTLIEEKEASRSTLLATFHLLTAQQEKEVSALIDVLISDELVIDSAISEERGDVVNKLDYSKPEYSKFEDMADLIMIDPIHEADAKKGWPEKPAL